MTPANEVSAMLSARVEEVAAMLLPGGKRSGAEWCAGSTAGEAGSSLKVHLAGVKAGVWCDFASNEKGDLLDLWKAARGVDFCDALKQAKNFLGLKDENKAQAFRPAAPRRYVRPQLDSHQELTSSGPVFEYLANARRIHPEILFRYRVQQMTDSKMGETCVFPIFDTRGLAVEMVKYLAVKRSPEGKKQIRASIDSRPRLFGWQAIDRNAREIVITEGEIDAMTVACWGWPALSVPSGSKNLEWIEHDYDALTRFDRIYIFTDADAPGNECADAIAGRIGRERCYRVTIPGYKDANEAECSGKFTGPDFEDRIRAARTLDPTELRNAADYADALEEEIFPKPDKEGSTLPWEKLENMRIRPSEISLVTGWSGHAKSHVLNQILLHDYAIHEQKILIASFEMPVPQSILQLSKMAICRTPANRGEINAVTQWLGGGVWFYDVLGVKPWKEFLPAFEYAVRRYGITRIAIDSLLRVGIAEDDYNGQKEFVSALVAFASKNQVHIWLVVHSRKLENEGKAPGKLDVRGAAAITDLVHNGWSMWRNKEREQKIAEARKESQNGTVDEKILGLVGARLTCWKNRKSGDEPQIGLWLNPPSQQFCDDRKACARVYFIPPAPGDTQKNAPV